MEHTTEIKLVNLDDLFFAEESIIKPEDVRQVVVKDALVNPKAKRLSLPQFLIQQLGLTPVRKAKVMIGNEIVERMVYSMVEFTILGRSDSMEVIELPDDSPVIVGYLVMGLLDLCYDANRGLIYNPAHGDERIEYQL